MDKLASAKGELAEIKEAVEAGDTAKAADMAAKLDEVKSIQSAIDEADKAEEMLKSLGTEEKKEVSTVEECKTIGEFAVKNLDMAAMRAGAKSVSTGFGYKSILGTNGEHMAPQIITYSQDIATAPERASIRDLLSVEAISGNAISYFVEGAATGEPDEVAQGGLKPQLRYDYTEVTVPLTKVAGWFYETDELISDAAFLRSAIENRAMRALREAANSTITGGIAGAIPEANKVTLGERDTLADGILKAMAAVETNSGYAADGVVINPADYYALKGNKDGNGQYYGGGYFMAPYGNGAYVETMPIWGLRTIVSTDVDEGMPIVGAFRDGATLITKAGEGASIEVHRGDHDDAINNRVTVVVEERLAVAVRAPFAFATIGE